MTGYYDSNYDAQFAALLVVAPSTTSGTSSLQNEQQHQPEGCDAGFAPSDTDRILLLKRGPTAPAFPSHWNLPGGCVDVQDQSPGIAALRECREEAGDAVADALRPLNHRAESINSTQPHAAASVRSQQLPATSLGHFDCPVWPGERWELLAAKLDTAYSTLPLPTVSLGIVERTRRRQREVLVFTNGAKEIHKGIAAMTHWVSEEEYNKSQQQQRDVVPLAAVPEHTEYMWMPIRELLRHHCTYNSDGGSGGCTSADVEPKCREGEAEQTPLQVTPPVLAAVERYLAQQQL